MERSLENLRSFPAVPCTVCELMYFSDNELLMFHRQGTHRFHRCTTGIPFTLLAFSLSASPRTRVRKFSWKKKKVAGDQPVIMCVRRKAPGKRLCGNLLNSVEPYHHFLQGRKITDRLHHLVLLLLIYSWIITKPSGSLSHTLIPRWHKTWWISHYWSHSQTGIGLWHRWRSRTKRN